MTRNPPAAARMTEPEAGAGAFDSHQGEHLASYSSRLALDWLAKRPTEKHLSLEGTLVFVDVSGFTALTERLAARGRAGAEEVNEIIGSTFRELGAIAGAYGADLLKWGGDAAVLLFEGSGSAPRGARAAWLMSRAMRRLGRLRTSVGKVELQVSVGVHSGALEFYLLGRRSQELVLAGPGATRTVQMESAASAGEVLVSPATAAFLEPDVLGESCGPGVLLRGEPQADERPLVGLPATDGNSAASLLPERLWRYLLQGEAQVEHRPVASGFVQLSGLDLLVENSSAGAAAVVDRLHGVVQVAQDAAEQYGVTFFGTDISADGFKILLFAGVPSLEGNDSDRLLRSLVGIVGPAARDLAGSSLTVRAGMNVGRLFVSSALGVGRRHIYSVTGDALNLAARVVAAAAPGEVRCTEVARLALRSMFTLRPMAPFAAKGKSEPVVTYAVEGEAATPPPVVEHTRPAIIGRDEELKALLAEAMNVEGGGAGKVVEVVGPAGIGKSRLIEEAVDNWPLATWRVACEAFSGGRPYEPLSVLARQLLGLDENVPAEQVALALLVTVEHRAPELLPWAPLLGDVFQAPIPSTPEVDELGPRFRRRRLEAVFVELVATLVPGPAAFVFEDTHALDQASSSLVVRMAEETEHNAWLVVTTTRPEVPSALEAAHTSRSVVQLAALDDSAAQYLLGQLTDQVLSSTDRLALAQRAAGNPLFLLELARAAETTGSAEALPDSLEPLLASRVDRLRPADRAALRTAAVLGLRFQDGLLAEVIDDPVLVDDALWERLSEFVREVDGERVFTHALVRDAAYEGLAFRRRRELHSRAAEAIERHSERTDLPVELLSVHWFAAERWDRAWECSRQAGEHAAGLYANSDAATHFRRALDAARLLRRLPRSEVARVAEQLGDVCERSGTYDRARTAYEQASRRLEHNVDQARLLRKVGDLHERRGRYATALRCYTRARRYLNTEGPDELVERCEIELAASGVRHRHFRLRDSMSLAEAATEDATRAGYRKGLAHSLFLRHINSVYLNEPDDALGHQALSIFVELGDLTGQGQTLNNLGISALYRGAWDEAMEHYRASRDAKERSGHMVGAATEENNIGEVLSDQGNYAEAQRYFETARSTWRASHYGIGEALANFNLGRLSIRTGGIPEGVTLLEEARASFESMHATSFVDDTDLRLLEAALIAGENSGTVERAIELEQRLAGRRGYQRRTAIAVALHARALAGQGQMGDARDLFDESVEQLRSLSEGFELAQALRARSAVRRGLGHEDEAAADAAEAEAIFERLGVVRY